MNKKIQNMIDIASSDGVITSQELKLIKDVAKKENINTSEIDFYILQLDVIVEDNSDFEISNEELESRILFWLDKFKIGKFEGVVKPFPLRKQDSVSKKTFNSAKSIMEKATKFVNEEEKKMGTVKRFGLKMVSKTVKKSTDMIPGGKLIKSFGNQLFDDLTPTMKNYTKEEIKDLLDRYLAIAQFRSSIDKFNKDLYNSISDKVTYLESLNDSNHI